MSVFRFRRLVFIWTPIYVAGVAMIAASADLTSTANGLTVLGAIVALTGLGAAAHDNKETT